MDDDENKQADMTANDSWQHGEGFSNRAEWSDGNANLNTPVPGFSSTSIHPADQTQNMAQLTRKHPGDIQRPLSEYIMETHETINRSPGNGKISISVKTVKLLLAAVPAERVTSFVDALAAINEEPADPAIELSSDDEAEPTSSVIQVGERYDIYTPHHVCIL